MRQLLQSNELFDCYFEYTYLNKQRYNDNPLIVICMRLFMYAKRIEQDCQDSLLIEGRLQKRDSEGPLGVSVSLQGDDSGGTRGIERSRSGDHSV